METLKFARLGARLTGSAVAPSVWNVSIILPSSRLQLNDRGTFFSHRTTTWGEEKSMRGASVTVGRAAGGWEDKNSLKICIKNHLHWERGCFWITWAEAGDFLIAPCLAWLWLLFFSYRSYLPGWDVWHVQWKNCSWEYQCSVECHFK